MCGRGPILVRLAASVVVGGCAVAAWAAEPAASGLLGELRGRLTPAPDVVVLGNSKVRTDLDLPALQAALPAPAPAFAGLGVPGTQAPVWYAVARGAVYAGELRPRGLLVYGTLAGALVTTLPAAPARVQLARLLAPDAPPELARVFGGALSAELLGAYTGAGGNVCEPGRTRPPELAAPVAPLPVAESFFAGLVRLGAERGARVGFVRQPVAPSGTLADEVPAADEAAARALVRASRGLWIDLRGGPLADERYFGDGVHMNEAGRHHATASLARELAALGDWLKRPPAFPAEPPPAPAPPTWAAPPAPLDLPFVAGAGCTASVTLPPELAAVSPSVLAQAGFAGASPVQPRIWARALAAGAAAGCDNTWAEAEGVVTAAVPADRQKGLKLAVIDTPEARGAAGLVGWWVGPAAPLTGDSARGRVALRGWAPAGGATLRAGAEGVEVPAGRFAVELASDGPLTVTSDRAWVLLRQVGAVVAPAPPTFDLRDAALEVGPAPPLPPVRVTRAAARPWSAAGDAEGLTVPGADAVMDAAGVGGCSPLRADGLQVSAVRGRITVAREDCNDIGGASSIVLHLAEDRGCGAARGRWLYPGDHATWTLPVAPSGGAWALELGGGALGGEPGARIDVRVSDADGELLRTPWLAESLRTDPPRWPLPRAPRGPVRVTLVSPATAPWLLFGRAALVEVGA